MNMKKKLYNQPQIEVVSLQGACGVMKTSIPLGPDPAPKRRAEVF